MLLIYVSKFVLNDKKVCIHKVLFLVKNETYKYVLPLLLTKI